MTLLQALAFLYAIHAAPATTDALTNAAKDHRADLALVSAIAVKESRAGTRGTIMTGAMLHLPQSACAHDPAHLARVRAARRAHRRMPLCLNRAPEAQAAYTARLFGGVPRRHWPRMLAGWRCGPNAACQATTGARYAREVLAERDRIRAALRMAR
jgi:hypothetical protein